MYGTRLFLQQLVPCPADQTMTKTAYCQPGYISSDPDNSNSFLPVC